MEIHSGHYWPAVKGQLVNVVTLFETPTKVGIWVGSPRQLLQGTVLRTMPLLEGPRRGEQQNNTTRDMGYK